MSQIHYLSLCPQCQQEVMILIGVQFENEELMLKYRCSKITEKKEELISLIEYFNFLEDDIKKSEGICHYLAHEYRKGIIYCCVCSQWLCDECRENHDQLYLNHLYSYFQININNTCLYHSNNTAALFCETCHEYFCKSCNKKHKGHSTFTFDKYKKHIYGKLNYPKFSAFESQYKTITNENQKIFKQRLEYVKKNIVMEEQYDNYYKNIINRNKKIFSLYELVFWNYNVLNNKSWDIFNDMNVIDKIQLESIISFQAFCQEKISKYELIYSLKYKKNRNIKSIKKQSIKFNFDKRIYRVYPLLDDRLLLVTKCSLYYYYCKTEKIELASESIQINRDTTYFSEDPMFEILEKSNLFMMLTYTGQYIIKGYYFWDYKIPNWFPNGYTNCNNRFSTFTEIEKDLIIGVRHSFTDDPYRIYYSILYKYKLVRSNYDLLKKKKSIPPSFLSIKSELEFQCNTIPGIISIIHYYNDVFYLITGYDDGATPSIFSINIGVNNPEEKFLKSLNNQVPKTAKKLNNIHFILIFNDYFQILEFKSLNSIFKLNITNVYELFIDDSRFLALYSDNRIYKAKFIDINDNMYYLNDNLLLVFNEQDRKRMYKFSKNQIALIAPDDCVEIFDI